MDSSVSHISNVGLCKSITGVISLLGLIDLTVKMLDNTYRIKLAFPPVFQLKKTNAVFFIRMVLHLMA